VIARLDRRVQPGRRRPAADPSGGDRRPTRPAV